MVGTGKGRTIQLSLPSARRRRRRQQWDHGSLDYDDDHDFAEPLQIAHGNSVDARLKNARKAGPPMPFNSACANRPALVVIHSYVRIEMPTVYVYSHRFWSQVLLLSFTKACSDVWRFLLLIARWVYQVIFNVSLEVRTLTNTRGFAVPWSPAGLAQDTWVHVYT